MTRRKPGDLVTSFLCGDGIRSLAVGQCGRAVALGDWHGGVYLLRTEGLDLTAPLVTAVRLYRYDLDGWDTRYTVRCEWCGRRFPVPDQILEVIGCITVEAGLAPGQSPCLRLAPEVWEEPGLCIECLGCGRALQFNPFVVDPSGRWRPRRRAETRTTASPMP